LKYAKIDFYRSTFDHALGFDTSNLDADECARLRPAVYRWLNTQLSETAYCKTHDACIRLDNGEWLMAPDVTQKVVYVLRNPLDVAVSMSYHNQKTIDASISELADPNLALAPHKPTRLDPQVEQRMGTWSHHVESWTQNDAFNTHIVRYEDMKTDPHTTFAKISSFLGAPHPAAHLERAIKNSSFDLLAAF